MLSNNNMLTTGGRSQRQRRSVRVNKPAYGFFITGSSLDAMNGVYVSRRAPQVAADSDEPVAALYYEHEDGLWHMALNELADAEEEDEEEEDEHQYWHTPKEKKPTHEWIFTDEVGRGRFTHDGDTIIPGAGVRWKHVHRTTAATPPTPSSFLMPSVSSAMTTVDDDNEDELPWQVIAILDVETVQDLLWSSKCRKEKVNAAKAGRTAEAPAAASLEAAFTPGAWLFRVKTSEGVMLYEAADETSAVAGRREHGEYLKGIELSKTGDWLRLDASEDIQGNDQRFMYDDSDEEDDYFYSSRKQKSRYHNNMFSRRELWVKIAEEGGWSGTFSLLEEVRPDETAVMGLKAVGDAEDTLLDDINQGDERPSEKQIMGYTGDYFDKPFVPRMEDGSQENSDVTIVDINEEVAESLAKFDESNKSCNTGAGSNGSGAPVGSAVTISGLTSRAGRQYNQVAGVVVQTCDPATGRVGVRLEAPFSGKTLSCRPDNLVFRLDEDDVDDAESSDASNASVRRAARLLGLTLTQIGLQDTTDELCGSVAWGFGGCTAGQRVGTALRCFLRFVGDVGGDAVPGRDAARLLIREINRRKAVDLERSGSSSDFTCSPVQFLSQGALGAEVAAVVSAAIDAFSASTRAAGLKALQQCVVSEKMRIRRGREAVFTMEEDCDLGEDSSGGDELLLRLGLIQALLMNRREAEALEEAKSVVKFEMHEMPSDDVDSCAIVSYLLGCCLLRLGMRAHGFSALENAKIVSLPLELQWLSPLQEWGASESEKLLHVHNTSERCKTAAVEQYSRGAFDEAAVLYGKARRLLEVGCSEDKRGRAMCLADRAGCLRRARKLDEAIEDLDAALRLFPRYSRALFRRAACFLEAGKANEAVDGFKTLYRVDRDWPHLNEWLIRAYTLRKRQSRGDYCSAEGEYDNPTDGKEGSADGFASATGVASEADRIAKEVDHYAVLGVTTDATEKQIKTAYRMRSLKFHPDKKGGHTAAFQRIAEAYHTLSDVDKRQAYDEGGDIKVKRGRRDEDDDSDDSEEEHKTTMREEVEREFYPEKYHFWPFGDPFIYKRKREAQKRKKEGRQNAWQDDPWA